jgi:hypothetical protein
MGRRREKLHVIMWFQGRICRNRVDLSESKHARTNWPRLPFACFIRGFIIFTCIAKNWKGWYLVTLAKSLDIFNIVSAAFTLCFLCMTDSGVCFLTAWKNILSTLYNARALQMIFSKNYRSRNNWILLSNCITCVHLYTLIFVSG